MRRRPLSAPLAEPPPPARARRYPTHHASRPSAESGASYLTWLCKQRSDCIRDQPHLERIAHALTLAPTPAAPAHAPPLSGASQRSQRRRARGGAHSSLRRVI